MGLYYNPPSPHIGAAQPLTEKQVPPASGPPPQNPFFGGVSLVATLVSAWTIPTSPPQQTEAIAAIVAGSTVAAYVPPAPSVQAQLAAAWTLTAWPVSTTSGLLASGPVPTNPPFAGAAVPEAVLIAWLPPSPQPPIVAVNLNPPIAGPVLLVGEDVPRVALRLPWRARPQPTDNEGLSFTAAAPTIYFDEEPHRLKLRPPRQAQPQGLLDDTSGLPFTATVTPSIYYEEENRRLKFRPPWLAHPQPNDIEPLPFTATPTPSRYYEEEAHRGIRRSIHLFQTQPDEFLTNQIQQVFVSWGFDEEQRRRIPRRAPAILPARDSDIEGLPFTAVVTPSSYYEEETHRRPVRLGIHLNQTQLDEFIPPTGVVGWGFEEDPQHQVPRRRAWRAAAQALADEFLFNPTQFVLAPWGFDEEGHRLKLRLWSAHPQPNDIEGLPFTAVVTPTLYYEEESHRLKFRAPWRAFPQPADIEGFTSKGVSIYFEEELHRLERRRSWTAFAQPNDIEGIPFTAVAPPTFYYDEEQHRSQVRRRQWLAFPQPSDNEGLPFVIIVSSNPYYEEEWHREQTRRSPWPAHPQPNDIEGVPFTAAPTPSFYSDEEPHRLKLPALRPAHPQPSDNEGLPFTATPTQSGYYEEEAHRGIVRRSIHLFQTQPDEFLFNQTQRVFASWGFEEDPHRLVRRAPAVLRARDSDIEGLPFSAAVPTNWAEIEQYLGPHARARTVHQADPDRLIFTASVTPANWMDLEYWTRPPRRTSWRTMPRPDDEGFPFTALPPPSFYYEEEAHRLQRRRSWLAFPAPNDIDGLPFTVAASPAAWADIEQIIQAKRRIWSLRHKPTDNEELPFTSVPPVVNWGDIEQWLRSPRLARQPSGRIIQLDELGFLPPLFPVPQPVPISLTLSPSSQTIPDSSLAGLVIGTATVVMSDGSQFTGTYSVTPNTYLSIGAGNPGQQMLLRNLSHADDGTTVFTVTATENSGMASASATITVTFVLPPAPPWKPEPPYLPWGPSQTFTVVPAFDRFPRRDPQS